MLERLRELFPGRSKREGEIWVQRMTHRGGWERRHANFTRETVVERPTSDENPLVATEPGRYRAIRRVDGRFVETIWEYETGDAEEYYERQRRNQSQLEAMAEMSVDELNRELTGETRKLDEVSRERIREEFEDRGGWEAL